MKAKSVQFRSMNIKLSARTYNEIDNFLSEQEAADGKAARSRASALRWRLDRAPR
jgi:hypothetical protein